MIDDYRHIQWTYLWSISSWEIQSASYFKPSSVVSCSIEIYFHRVIRYACRRRLVTIAQVKSHTKQICEANAPSSPYWSEEQTAFFPLCLTFFSDPFCQFSRLRWSMIAGTCLFLSRLKFWEVNLFIVNVIQSMLNRIFKVNIALGFDYWVIFIKKTLRECNQILYIDLKMFAMKTERTVIKICSRIKCGKVIGSQRDLVKSSDLSHRIRRCWSRASYRRWKEHLVAFSSQSTVEHPSFSQISAHGIGLERVFQCVCRSKREETKEHGLTQRWNTRSFNEHVHGSNAMEWCRVDIFSGLRVRVREDGSLKGCSRACRSFDNLRNGNGLRNAIIIYLDLTSTWLTTVRWHCSLSLRLGCELEIWFCMHDHFLRARGDFEIESKTFLLSYAKEIVYLFDWWNKLLKNWQISVEIDAR